MAWFPRTVKIQSRFNSAYRWFLNGLRKKQMAKTFLLSITASPSCVSKYCESTWLELCILNRFKVRIPLDLRRNDLYLMISTPWTETLVSTEGCLYPNVSMQWTNYLCKCKTINIKILMEFIENSCDSIWFPGFGKVDQIKPYAGDQRCLQLY